MKEYSEAELKMFESLGISEMLIRSVPVHALYSLGVERCFFYNLAGNNIDAFRKAARAVLKTMRPYRLTPEFDKLCEF